MIFGSLTGRARIITWEDILGENQRMPNNLKDCASMAPFANDLKSVGLERSSAVSLPLRVLWQAQQLSLVISKSDTGQTALACLAAIG